MLHMLEQKQQPGNPHEDMQSSLMSADTKLAAYQIVKEAFGGGHEGTCLAATYIGAARPCALARLAVAGPTRRRAQGHE